MIRGMDMKKEITSSFMNVHTYFGLFQRFQISKKRYVNLMITLALCTLSQMPDRKEIT